MKVIHVITGLGNGGAEALLVALLNNDAKNFHIVISLTDSGHYGKAIEEMGVELHCLNMGRYPLSPISYLKLYRFMRLKRPDVIQCWMYHANIIGGIIGKLSANRVIWSIHQAHTDIKRNGFRNALVIRACALLSYMVPNIVIYCSKLAHSEHLKVGFNNSLSFVIHNGVDTKKFKPLEDTHRALVRQRLFGVDSNLSIIGMVARYTHEKDFPNLFEALRICAEYEFEFILVLVGKGMTPKNLELMTLIKKFGITERVRLLGLQDNVPEIMAALDLHVMSSSVEGFGNVVAEAMACGTPAIGTQTGAIYEMIGFLGWIVPIKNAPELANAINRALHERMTAPELWQARRGLCRERIEQSFSIKTMVSAMRLFWSSDNKTSDTNNQKRAD